MRTHPGITTIILLALVAVHIVSYYHQLPDPIASHFGADGTPNGWMSKNAFLALYALLTFGFSALLPATAWISTRRPTRWVNLPHKDYWLAPERRASTRSFILQSMFRIANATLVLLLAIMHLTFRANLLPDRRLDTRSTWLVLALYAAFMAILVGMFYWRFRAPKTPAPADRNTPAS